MTPDEMLAEAGAHCRAGRLEAAAALYAQVLEVAPEYAPGHFMLGSVLYDLGRLEEAAASLGRGLVLQPEHPEAHHGLGTVLFGLKRYDEAIAHLGRAVMLGLERAEGRYLLGLALHRTGRLEEAVANFRCALALRPDWVEAHFNLGNVHQEMARFDEAAECYRRTLEVIPDLAEAHGNLGLVLARRAKFEEALVHCRRSVDLAPEMAGVHANLGAVLTRLGRLGEAVASFRRALAVDPDLAEIHSSLIFTMDLDPATSLAGMQEERRLWYQRHGLPLARTIRPHGNPRDPERPLRVGYVSADFRRHSAAHIFGRVLENHDRETYPLYLYSNSRLEDEETARFRACAAGWRPIVNLSDEAVAEAVRADGIDILVDLSGHTNGNRLRVFARKPAPIQVTAWGHAHGTGLPTIDAFFADPVYVAPGDRHLFAETVVDLPCFFPFGPPENVPPVTPLPAASSGYVTFGCFNRLTKVTEAVLAVWAEALRRVSGSRLVLKDLQLNDAGQRARVLETLAGHGIGGERVDLIGFTPRAEHLAAFARVDIALDPFPQNGGVSTLEAMWMGVPTVTLLGRTPPGRSGAAICKAITLDDFIAATPEAYVDIATRQAADLAGLARLRAGLRQRLADSPLGNPPLYARAVEAAYRTLWRQWCGRAIG
ncbi:MAG: tetratricopeptide repeat protein [Alphaproteobacteria bacterium]